MTIIEKVTKKLVKDFGSEVNSVEIEGKYVNFKISNRKFWGEITPTGRIKKNSYHQILI